MTTPILGALELLAIHARAPMLPSPEGATWLRDNGLIEDVAGVTVLTERGTVWLKMLADTPLPVPTSAWADPRAIEDANTAIIRAPAGLYPPPPPPAEIPPPDALPPQPPGFTLNTFTDLKPGQVPPNWSRDVEVECVWRNGKRVKNFAGAVLWGHRNSPTDVIYVRVIEAEPLLVAGK